MVALFSQVSKKQAGSAGLAMVASGAETNAMRYPSILICVGLVMATPFTRAADSRPNVLFLVADDLNDWIGSLQRNPQTKTPNLDPARQLRRELYARVLRFTAL